MNRVYFTDISELKKHGGKIVIANKTIIPAIAAAKFPSLEVNFSDDTSLKLPFTSQEKMVESGSVAIPKVYFPSGQVWKNQMARFWIGDTRRVGVTFVMLFPLDGREVRWTLRKDRAWPGVILNPICKTFDKS